MATVGFLTDEARLPGASSVFCMGSTNALYPISAKARSPRKGSEQKGMGGS